LLNCFSRRHCESETPPPSILESIMRSVAQFDSALSTSSLSSLRKAGLLPASRTIDQNGKMPFHPGGQAVTDQANCAFDLLDRGLSRNDTLITLWLGGYHIKTANARRALLKNISQRRKWRASATCVSAPQNLRPPYNFLFLIFGALKPANEARWENLFQTLEDICRCIGLLPQTWNAERQFIYGATGLMLGALEDSTLLSQSQYKELETARMFTRDLLEMFHDIAAQAPGENCAIERIRLVETIGVPTFLCTLLLLRMGFETQIKASQLAFTSVERPAKQGTVRNLRQQLRSIWTG
jgi:hypothetical protein